MEGNERAYDFHQLVCTGNTLNRLTTTEYKESGLKFGRLHNKMKNVWADLHPLTADERPCDLSDYSLIDSDAEVISALQEGLAEAQTMLRVLNMAPSPQCTNKRWFLTPWLIETSDPLSFAYSPGKSPVRGEDGDAEVLRADLEAGVLADVIVDSSCNPAPDSEEEIFEDGSSDLPVLEAEAESAITEMLDLQEPQVMSALPKEKVIPFVESSGHQIYKSTLVSQLNANPFLSKDRLTRVKHSIYFNNSEDYIAASSCTETMFLGLGMDCGVYFMQRNTTTMSSSARTVKKRTRERASNNMQVTCVLNAVDEGTWCIGRVQKMRRKVGSRWGNCTQPLDLQKRDVNRGKRPGVGACTVMVYLNYFRKVPGFLKFKYDLTDSIWIDVDTIISTVTMTYDKERELFELDPVDSNSLNEFLKKNK